MMMKISRKHGIVIIAILFLTGCQFAGLDTNGEIPGFFEGVWHGILAPYTLILRWFIDIQMYELPNTGFGYDAGFLLGLVGSIPVGWFATLVALSFYFFV